MAELNIINWVIIVTGIIAIILMFAPKKDGLNKIATYVIALWALIVAFINVTAVPDNMMMSKVLPAVFGVVSVIGVILSLTSKSEKMTLTAKLMSAAGFIMGIIYMMM